MGSAASQMGSEGRAAAASARWRASAEAGEVEGLMATLAEEVVFYSPITERKEFRGKAEVRALMEAVFETISGIRYSDDFGDERRRALVYRARIGDQEVNEATVMRLNEAAEIVEVTFWFRPLPGLTALTAALGPKLARRGSRPRALVLAALAKPIYLLTRIGDRVGVWLVG